MKKETVMGSIITYVSIAMIFTFVSCGSSPSYSSPSSPPKWAGIVLTGEDEPLLEGTTWTLPGVYTYEFRANGRLVRRGSDGNVLTYTETWKRDGDIITVIFGNGVSYFEGKYYQQTQKIMLTGKTSDGEIWEQTWVPFEGSSFTVASNPQTNVYVQQPAPAPSSSGSSSSSTPSRNVGKEIADAFRSPIQSGTYSLAGTQAKIRLSSIAKSGILTYTTKQGRSGSGSYSIDGNRMTIQMEGYTFLYTVTSETSFRGDDGTWVRTGY